MNIFQLIPKLYFNDHSINNLTHELKSQDFNHVFLVCSNAGFNSQAFTDTIQILKQLKADYFVYQLSNNYVSAEEIYEASILFKNKKANLIIVIGSNVAIDFAKVLSIYTPNKSIHHSVWHFMQDPGVIHFTAYPIVAIPINFAIGSCSNGLSIVYNDEMKIAQGVISYTSTPKVVIFDVNYLKTIPEVQLKQYLLYCILDTINCILNDYDNKNLWTINYNYANLLSVMRATITLMHDINNQESWDILMLQAYFNGGNLNKFSLKYPYDLLSLFLGMNPYLHADYVSLMNTLFFVYCKHKINLDPQFKENFRTLMVKLFNKDTYEITILQQYLNQIVGDLNLSIKIEDEKIANKMIEQGIVQYQKNYLDVIDTNKQSYNDELNKTTVLFTKIVYEFI